MSEIERYSMYQEKSGRVWCGGFAKERGREDNREREGEGGGGSEGGQRGVVTCDVKVRCSILLSASV